MRMSNLKTGVRVSNIVLTKFGEEMKWKLMGDKMEKERVEDVVCEVRIKADETFNQ